MGHGFEPCIGFTFLSLDVFYKSIFPGNVIEFEIFISIVVSRFWYHVQVVITVCFSNLKV